MNIQYQIISLPVVVCNFFQSNNFNTIHSHVALMLHVVTEELNLNTFVYFIFNNNADSSCFYIKYESQLSDTCGEVKSTRFPSELQQRRRIKSKHCGTKTKKLYLSKSTRWLIMMQRCSTDCLFGGGQTSTI